VPLAKALTSRFTVFLREAKIEGQGADDETSESGGEQQTSPEVTVAAADLPAAVADVPVRTFNPDAGRLG
jgi:hypothetical protein